MLQHKLAGVGAAMITPFTRDGRVDYEALARMVDYVIEGGVDYIVTLGTTAETPTLYMPERAVIAMFITNHIAGRVPLVMGCGGNSTSEVLDQLREFDLRGADAILSVAPYYNKPSQEGLFQHFRTVSEHSPLPVILYNIPGRTGVNMTAETTLRCARELKNVIGVKEASGNIEQMQQILDSGECSQPARALKLVGAMLKAHPESAYNQVERDIITATALEFANNGWKTDRALDRADYFITSWRANRLHTMFDTLPFWQRRIVCGCKGDNNFCTRASLEWALDHVHLPADKYPGCCWRNGYKLYNLYGEIIHGPGYFEPFGDMFGDNSMLFTREVGGVCGGLSHFGAYSACANGVPAATSGEPGHCSFVVLIDGKWTPSYSLTWDRSLHWTPWQQTYGFSSLHMASKLYSPEQQSRTDRSQTELSLANLYAGQAKPDLKKANELYQRAIADQPCNFAAWRAYSRFLEKNKPDDHRVWSQLNGLVCKKLAADLPEMAAHILSKFVYPRLGATAASPQELMDDFGKFWGAVDKMEISRWNIERFLSSQLNLLKKDGKVSDQSKVELYGKVLGTTVSNTAYAPVILSWGSEISAKMDPASQKKILDTTVQAISGDKSIGVKDRDKMLASAVINAEQMRDRKAFQSISRMLSGAYTNPNNKMPQFEPFPGKLVSEDGLLFLSSSSKQHDDPCAHPGVLRLSGGRFHTEKDKEAWAAVELSRLVEVSGVVVVTTPNNMGRMHGMRIQVSESGKDGEWKDVGKPVQEVKQRVNRYDLSTEKPRARFIRVLRPEPADFFHLNGIYVYGTPAS